LISSSCPAEFNPCRRFDPGLHRNRDSGFGSIGITPLRKTTSVSSVDCASDLSGILSFGQLLHRETERSAILVKECPPRDWVISNRALLHKPQTQQTIQCRVDGPSFPPSAVQKSALLFVCTVNGCLTWWNHAWQPYNNFSQRARPITISCGKKSSNNIMFAALGFPTTSFERSRSGKAFIPGIARFPTCLTRESF
jgi:hypothetical protein